jgi:hypothetical protein
MLHDTFASDPMADLSAQGWTMLPGSEPGTALRLCLEPCPKGGCVHLQQMAYSPTLGWYRQKSFSLPREMLGDLARLLRVSQCLLPQPASAALPAEATLKFPAAGVSGAGARAATGSD